MKKLNILAAIAILAAAVSACSVKETPVIEETPSQEGKVVTLGRMFQFLTLGEQVVIGLDGA